MQFFGNSVIVLLTYRLFRFHRLSESGRWGKLAVENNFIVSLSTYRIYSINRAPRISAHPQSSKVNKCPTPPIPTKKHSCTSPA